MLNSFAAFDCLYIGNRLQKALRNFAAAEAHMLAYLACLLSLYRNQPVSDWGYGFSGTRNGSPFSFDLNAAFDALRSAGLVAAQGDYFTLTTDGEHECAELSVLSMNQERIECLDGACSCLLTMPIGIVRNALLQEPMLRPVAHLTDARPLLEGPGLELLYEQFKELSAAIGVEVVDLMVPATVWLSYLAGVARSSDRLESAHS